MIGKTLAHYEVTEKLGKDGMSKVYSPQPLSRPPRPLRPLPLGMSDGKTKRYWRPSVRTPLDDGAHRLRRIIDMTILRAEY